MLVQVHSSMKRLDYPVYSFIQKVIIMKVRLQSYKSNEEISEAYGCEFDGDFDKFLRLRWEKDLSRIDRFISETLSYLRELHNETTA